MEIFGPVHSRRLGLSLGINHLPPKTCSYSCVYCQLGRTSFMTTNWTSLSHPDEIFSAVKDKLEKLEQQSIRPDYVTFVSNGEPTLDKDIGQAIRLINSLGVRTAVISNSSLLWHPGVRAQIMEADAVSLKVDSIKEKTWHKIDRPHGSLNFLDILNGIRKFADDYKGVLLIEMMLVRGLNDSHEEAESAAKFIANLHPSGTYLSLPLRPPAEIWVKPPEGERLLTVFKIFRQYIAKVELLMELPDAELPYSSKPLKDLLSTLKVHPIEAADVHAYLLRHGLNQETLNTLLEQNRILKLSHGDMTFFVANYTAESDKRAFED